MTEKDPLEESGLRLRDPVRLSFDIERDTWDVLRRNIPNGIRKYVYRAIIEGLVSHIQRDRVGTLTAIVQKTWSIEEILGIKDGGST